MAPERWIMNNATKPAAKKIKLKVRVLEEKAAPATCGGKVACSSGAIGAVMDI